MMPPDKKRSLSVVSLTTVPNIVSDELLSDNESCSTTTSTITAASSVQVKRRVRRTRMAIGTKCRQRRSDSKKVDNFPPMILLNASEGEFHQVSKELLPAEDEEYDEEEILEEIEESFEDSVEVLQLSALDGNGNKLLDGSFSEKIEVDTHELSLELSGIDISDPELPQREKMTELWKADSKTCSERRGSASRMSSKPALKPQGSLR